MPKELWKKGQSGNPKGRPRVRTIQDAMRNTLRRDLSKFAGSLMEISIKAETPSGAPDYTCRMRAAEMVVRLVGGTAGARFAQKAKPLSVVVEEEATNGNDYSDQTADATPGTETSGA